MENNMKNNIKKFNKGMNNRGSATIFMVLLLIPIVVFFCMVIRYAQLAATKGMAADAVSLANNAIYASYNQPMRDAYGIYCYTKTDTEMTDIANYYMDKSMDVNAQVYGVVVYQGESLDNDAVFTQQIVDYMGNWDKVAGNVTGYQLQRMVQIRERAVEINEQFKEDYEKAVDSTYTAEPVADESEADGSSDTGEMSVSLSDAEEAREYAVGIINVDFQTLNFTSGKNEDKPNYENSVSFIESTTPVIDCDNSNEINLSHGIQIMDNAINYLEPSDKAFQSWLNKDTNYKVALYAYNNFSSFQYFGSAALTGNYYESGDVVSISPWAETEFILNGTDSDQNNAETVKRMIYDCLVMEYVTILYDSCMNNEEIQEYAEVLSGGNPDRIQLIKDEFLIGIAAKLAFDKICNCVYEFGYSSDTTFGSYPYYIEYFLMLETQRDYSGMLSRMKYTITANMQNPTSSAQANEFSFDNAYLMPVIDSYHVNVTPSFGGVMSFEGR